MSGRAGEAAARTGRDGSPAGRRTWHWPLLLAPLLALSHAAADSGLPAALDGRLRAVLLSSYAAARLSQPPEPIATAGTTGDASGSGTTDDRLVPCFIEGRVDAAALEVAGAFPGREYGGRWTARVPLHRLTAVARLAGVRHVRAASRLTPQLDISAADTRAALVQGGLPDTARGPTGEGVLLGIIDSGIHWAHADFKTPAGLTRIAGIWDQTDAPGPRPAGYTYGTEWSEAQINLGMCRETDSTFQGHGTHVAGIAAGSGRATGNGQPAFTYVGVAPRARLAVVKTTFFDTDVADGVAWLFQKASQLQLPCVANLSLGGAYGAHDGTSQLDLALNALSGPGRVVVASAGNQNGRGAHGEATTPPTGYALMTVHVFPYTPDPVGSDGLSIDGWYEGGDDLSLTVVTPSGTLVGPVAKGGTLIQPTPDGWISIDQTGAEATNINGDVEALIEISDAAGTPPAAGDYELRVARIAAPHGGKADFWIYDDTFSYSPAFAQGRVEGKTVLSPAEADSVIAVTAHTTRVSWTSQNGMGYTYGQTLNQIASFSSLGPRRDGVLKPDISAPGSAIGSASSASVHPAPSTTLLPDGMHKILQGTSMSTAQVAGAVALLEQRFGPLAPGQVRAALTASARSDLFTGAVPNTTWGYGKLDLEQLFRRLQDFVTYIDPPYVMSAGNQIPLTALCLKAGPQTWRIPGGHARLTDTHGWLRRGTTGPLTSLTSFDDTTAAAYPGQRVCIPRTGQLLVAIPAGTPAGDSTVVTLQMEPLGLPFMRQTRSMTVRVGALSAAGGGPERPLELGLSILGAGTPTISFDLAHPAAGWVNLALYDVQGRRVALLLDGPLEAGYRRIEWHQPDAGRLSAGLYFARIVDGPHRLTRRVLVTG